MQTELTRHEVLEWVHATSDENFSSIKKDGFLKDNRCVDDYFDRALCEPGAPMGTWFNANDYNKRPITVTTYPESLDKTIVVVKALAYRVAAFFNPEKNYELFKVSDEQRKYRQVKYAVLEDTDPWILWARGRLEPVPRTRARDGYCDEQ